ncbi:MAG: hypothetical protein B7Z10_09335 [Rhodobacterales bacterium 32-66-7]|nr:MAG: hypothetical protein B7Z10_09335 [Rhodobacterales bacterium 32-66-7]
MTFKAEGGLGFVGRDDIGIYSIVRQAPDTATSQFEDYGSLTGGPTSLSFRGEANWAFDLGNGSKVRVGGILSGLDGSSSEVSPIYYLVAAQPGGPGDEPILGQIRVCAFPDPCATFDGKIDRSYTELMPEVMVGRNGADGSTSWFGLQGFSGRLDEATSNRAFRLAPASAPFDTTTTTDLDADVTGFMLAFQHERTLKSGLELFVGAGLGRYEFDTTGTTTDTDTPANAKTVSGTVDGTRAQFAIGLEKPMGKGLTLGAMIRADYWTDQPRIQADWSTPPCSPTLCAPPGATGNFTLNSADQLSISVGVSLTLRM